MNRQKSRIDFLDSSRGIAAFIVLLAHFELAIVPELSKTWIFKSPLLLLFAADAAVIYFFILSGYILTRSIKNIESSSIKNYFNFIVRRIFRIYPAFIFAFGVTVLCLYLGQFPGNSEWLSGYWKTPLDSVTATLKQLILVKRIPNDPTLRILPHDWTLSIEMAVSLLLPLLAIVAWVNSFLMLIIIYFSIKLLGLDPFVFDFAIGVFIATQHETWQLKKGKWILLLSSAFLICIGYFFPGPVSVADHLLIHHQTWGLAGLMILMLSSKKLQGILSIKPLVFLGKISYSFYLFHLVILLVLSNLLGSINSISFLIIFIALTVVVSTISYYLVEKPFIKLSHKG